MRQVVDRILDGKFIYEKGNLGFSVDRIEIDMNPNDEYNGSFNIISLPGKVTEGRIYCYDLRMTLLTDSFSGIDETIGYTFSTKGLSEGDVVKGEIYIISNQGEYYLPYLINVVHTSMETSLGSVKNLFHFTNLAKTNWDEAVKLFYSDDFKSLFKGSDKQFYKSYIGLSHYYNNEQNVEEFLLEINKKHAIEYISEQEELVFSDPYEDVLENIVISRNGWGFTALNVETDSDFIAISKTSITDNDFLGNYLKFPIIILHDLLHDGNNFGTVRFYNSFTSFEIKVTVYQGSIYKGNVGKNIEFARATKDLMTYYLAFRNRKIDKEKWLAESSSVIDRMQNMEEKSITVMLYKAQLLLTEDRFNEAKWVLDQAEAEFQSREQYRPSDWAYYLYLTTLYNREEKYIDEITEEIESIYRMNTSQWRVAWLLLYLTEEFAYSPSKKWVFLETLLHANCTSPVIYAEALHMVIANPAIISKMDIYEQRLIRYALKNNMLTDDLKKQIVYVLETKKVYSDTAFEVLKAIYNENNSNEVLEVICELLIKGDKTGEEYYPWYKLGIENQCHTTRLYEYFMNSVDITKNVDIPKMVYLYFSYHSDLDWEHNAYLYARVIDIKSTEPELYISYKDEIEKFAFRMIVEGRINKNLSTIYKQVINDEFVTEELAKKLSSLIFMHRIIVDRDDLTRVVVFQCRENIEKSYPIINKEAFIPIYANDFTILFEDGLSNRYMKSVDYDIEKLMVVGKISNMLTPYVNDNTEFDVYVCECSSEMSELDEAGKDRYQRLFDSEDIEEEYKSLIRNKLLQFYYDNDKIRELDLLLESIDAETISAKERATCIRYFILRGMYDRAFEWICTYGLEGIEVKDIMKLASRIVNRGEEGNEEKITCLCRYVFNNGKYDENVLRYLVDNFHGMTKDIRKLFLSAGNFNIDVYKLCENALIQMLYTGYFVSERSTIYKDYVSKGPNGRVRMAFLAQCSFEYFVKEQLVESYIFEEVYRLAGQGEELPLVCKLALVKYCSENKSEVDGAKNELIKKYLHDFLEAGIYMSFFKEFMEQGLDKINNFSDKTIVEYKTTPGRKVMIHYIIEKDDDSKGEYLTREMKDMYYGIHAKAFVLFFGENLLYYITEEADGEELLTQSGSISKSDISNEIVESRFSEINDIVIAKTLQDYNTAQDLIREYYKKEFIVNKLFELQ